MPEPGQDGVHGHAGLEAVGGPVGEPMHGDSRERERLLMTVTAEPHEQGLLVEQPDPAGEGVDLQPRLKLLLHGQRDGDLALAAALPAQEQPPRECHPRGAVGVLVRYARKSSPGVADIAQVDPPFTSLQRRANHPGQDPGGSQWGRAAERRWAAYCGEAGVSATLHQLRHTHATELVNDGVSPRHDPQTPRPQEPPDHRALSEQTDHVADQELAVHRVGAGVEDLPQQPQIARAGVPGAPVVLAVDAAGDRADRQGIFRRDEDVPAGCWGWSSAGRRRRRRGRFVNGRPGELRRRVEGG